MSENEKEVETVFTARNEMGAVLERIVGAGERINHVFNHASHMLGSFASVAAVVGGGFSLESSIESTKEYLSSISRISTLTGLSANHTDALLESMEKVGIEGEGAERILLGMSRRTASMELHMSAAGQATGSMATAVSALGLNLKKDTVSVFEQLAEKVQKNKLGIAELGIAFGIPRTQTVSLFKMLQKGPEYIRENIEEAKKYGVTVGDLTAYKRVASAQREIAASWKRINVIVGSELLPLIGDLLKGGADRLKGWVSQARSFGTVMSNFLREHHTLLIGIGKVMLANFTIMKLTGTGIGGNATALFGRVGAFVAGGARGGGVMGPSPSLGWAAGRAAGGAGAVVSGLANAVRGLGRFVRGDNEFNKLNASILRTWAAREARAAAAVSRAAGNSIVSGGWITEKLFGGAMKAGDTASRIGGAIKGFDVGKILTAGRVFLGIAGRVTVIGAVVALVVGAFLAVKNNVYGIRDQLTALWDRIVLRFHAIGIALQPLFHLFSSDGVMGRFFSQVVSRVFTALGAVIDGLLSTMHTLIHVFAIIAKDGLSALTRPVLLWQTAAGAARADMAIAARQDRETKARATAAASRETPDARDKQPNFDFRGSHFDIKQAFSDVDPDRIAVAFANDLAGLGEKRVQSSFSPLWAV